MKNLVIGVSVLLLVSCGTKETETAPEERSIGFNTVLPEKKWHLGTDTAIQVVKDLDKAWVARDYEAMRTYFADTAKCYFPDGKIANSADEFVKMVEANMEGLDISWTFDYAFSVDLDPSTGGEHVQAGFTGTLVSGEMEEKTHYHEWYYVIDGKIVMWRQFTLNVKED